MVQLALEIRVLQRDLQVWFEVWLQLRVSALVMTTQVVFLASMRG